MTGPIVRVEDVSKTFGPTIRALDGVSLEFEPGIIYGLLGPNGAGKTTLIRVLATLLKPDSGRAWVAGVDVVANPTAARERIGLAGQFAAVDEYLSGRENVEMVAQLYNLPAAEARRRADEVLERIGLDEAGDRLVRTYSGGMKRRIDLAASLVGRPQVLFLDEPTTGIDPGSRIGIWDLITDLVAGGTTVLLTTQYLDEADHLADRIAVIDHGKLISEGTADELKDRIGGSVIEVSVTPELRDATIATLRPVGGDDVSYEQYRGAVCLPAPDGSQTLLAAMRSLDAAGITPADVALHKPTLDDVFLTLTGHVAVTDGEGEPEPAPSGRRRRTR